MIKSMYRLGLYRLAALLVVVAAGVSPAMARDCIDCHAETAGARFTG